MKSLDSHFLWLENCEKIMTNQTRFLNFIQKDGFFWGLGGGTLDGAAFWLDWKLFRFLLRDVESLDPYEGAKNPALVSDAILNSNPFPLDLQDSHRKVFVYRTP